MDSHAEGSRREPGMGRVLKTACDSWVMAGRNFHHTIQEPLSLADVTLQPALFAVLFVYVFGSGIVIDGGSVSYVDYALPGLLLLNITTSTTSSAVGLANDLNGGLVARLRSLPMWLPAIVAGRAISEAVSACICSAVMVLTGLAIGWRLHSDLLGLIGGIGVGLLYAQAIAWVVGCIALRSKGPESAVAVGFLLLFPMAFVSNALVPTGNMPPVVRAIAEWNPFSAVTAAIRDLWGVAPESDAAQAWPLEHAIPVALGWSILILAVAVPMTMKLLRRRTQE
jgi:ABC-2 type transport system permease protein